MRISINDFFGANVTLKKHFYSTRWKISIFIDIISRFSLFFLVSLPRRNFVFFGITSHIHPCMQSHWVYVIREGRAAVLLTGGAWAATLFVREKTTLFFQYSPRLNSLLRLFQFDEYEFLKKSVANWHWIAISPFCDIMQTKVDYLTRSLCTRQPPVVTFFILKFHLFCVCVRVSGIKYSR